MQAKTRGDQYGHLQSALKQAMQDSEAVAERREREMDSLQQMVATTDGMSLLMWGGGFLAVCVSLMYLPTLWEGDPVSLTVLGAMAALAAVGASYQFLSHRKKG